MEKYFCELDADGLAGGLILLDIDGTIIADGSEKIDGRAADKIKVLLAGNAAVLLVSNNRNATRVKKIAAAAGVPYLDTPYRKPDKKILDAIGPEKNRPITVIGDKFLTDGLFAEKCGIGFIKIKRVTSPRDRWYVKASYRLDDLIGPLFTRRARS